jgi:hypothetical protein
VSTLSSAIREWAVTAIRDESVALQADVAYEDWSSETAPRVFVGQTGYLGARNRGRLPFIEVTTQTQTFGNETGEGGTARTELRLVLHATGRDVEATIDRMHSIMIAAISAVRDNREFNYMQLGTDRIEEVQPGPMGWKLEAVLEMEHSYDRTDYEQI